MTDVVVRVTCTHDCPDACSALVTVDPHGRALDIRADASHPVTGRHLCVKVDRYLERVYSPDRLTTPLRRTGAKGDAEFTPIGWDEAVDEIASRWNGIVAEVGPEAILGYSYLGSMGILDGFGTMQALFNRLGATRLERSICGPQGFALAALTRYPWSDPENLPDARTVVVWGMDPVATSIHTWDLIRRARRNGARLVVVDPYRSRTAAYADVHVRPHVGTDGALALALGHVIVRDGLEDDEFVATRTSDVDAYRAAAEPWSPERAEEETGVAAQTIVELAHLVATARPTAFRIGVGMQRAAGAGSALRAIQCLTAVTGQWRWPAGGISQAVSIAQLDLGSVSRPDLSPAGTREVNMIQLGRVLTDPALAPPIRSLYVWNSNPAVIAADQQRVLSGLRRDDLFTVVHDQFLTDTARFADVVLPAPTMLEHADLVGSWGFSYLSWNEPAIAPIGESKSNAEVARLLAGALGFTDEVFSLTDEELMELALAGSPAAAAGIDADQLRREGVVRVGPRLGTGVPPGASFAFSCAALAAAGLDPVAEYRPPANRPTASAPHPLRLLTLKRHYSINSSYGSLPVMLNAEPAQLCELHPDDAAGRGIGDGDEVDVYNELGRIRCAAKLTEAVPPGTVAVPFGRWRSDRTGGGANSLTSDLLGDLAHGPTFCDNLVEVELRRGDVAQGEVNGDRLRVDVLGPLRARDTEGRDVTPDGTLQRRLLALLVLRRGRIVPVDEAIEVLWPVRGPRDPVAALHNHVFRLRRGLPDGVVASAGNGYRASPELIDLDADRLATALNAHDPTDPAVLTTIDDALDRWRGPAYPELDDVDDGRAEATRLGELRVRALETRAEARLAAGALGDVAAELAALADEEPLRERPRSLLMTALAKAGRTVEALRVYDDFRRLLGDEFGIEPSPALSAQHAALLRGVEEVGWTPATRLPAPVTSLVGRDTLLADLLAAAGVHRLVTLIGPGGVGKTRLLTEIGHRLRAVRPDRPVVMGELATASEESAVDVVAAALGIDGRPGVGLAERVAAVLADTEIVLLLDNCEHVLDPMAHLVERLLGACPGVSMVATSRERLRAPAEQLYAVPTLATVSAPAQDAAAVQLFVERARAAAPGFAAEPADRAVIAEIVARLDGLPLAIELAAARLHTLDLAEVAAGLDRRFALLSSGYRTSPRHESLGAAVSWSYELLDARLQRTFADLSVFAGSFTVADAAAVGGVDVATAAPALDQLVERSLVMRAPDRRYVLLETLRAFGDEQLVAEGRADVAGERHARHFVDWVNDADRHLVAPDGDDALGQIDAALPELRTALGWLLDHEQPELAGRLVGPLLDYAFLRLRPDVLAWAERVTAADPDDRSPYAAVVWAVSGYAAWMAGDVEEAGRRGDHARRLCERAGGPVPPEVADLCGSYQLFQGRLDEAVTWYRRARDAAAGDRAGELLAGCNELLALAYGGDPAAADVAAELLADIGDARSGYAAYAWYCAGEADLAVDVERALVRFDRALELAEATHASFVAGVAGASRASIVARVGDPHAAAADYRRLISHWQRAGMWSTQWTMLRSVAGLLARLGRHRDAAALAGAVRATRSGHRIFGADEAALDELESRLRRVLGDEVYATALADGAELDGDAAVELALRAL